MRSAELTILATTDDPISFVKLWSRQYRDPRQDLYRCNIGQIPYSESAIVSLFIWKNGGTLSGKKEASVLKHYVNHRLDDMPIDIEKYLADHCNGNGGAIWPIFWLHCLDQKIPIYDQHVHRAMCHISGFKFRELEKYSDRKKVYLYLKTYRPFLDKTFAGIEPIKVDQAMWMFGKFLKAWPKFMNRACSE